LAPAPTDTGELVPRPTCPRRRAKLVEAVGCGCECLCRRPLLPLAPTRAPEREQGAGLPVRIARCVVLDDRLLEQRRALVPSAGGRRQKAATAPDVGEHPRPLEAHRVRLPLVEHARRVLAAAEREQRLDMVAGPPSDRRFSPLQAGCLPGCLVE